MAYPESTHAGALVPPASPATDIAKIIIAAETLADACIHEGVLVERARNLAAAIAAARSERGWPPALLGCIA
jgi:hypothetical protein